MTKRDAPSEKSKQARAAAEACRKAIVERLEDESEFTLAAKLGACGEKFTLHCTNCGETRSVEKGCKQKWCPVCSRRIAAMRSARYALGVGMMQWPLFSTLTVPHDDSPPLLQLRRLKRAFGKLRKRKLWTAHVKGGVAGLEINSKSGEFHPHLHIIVDCRWLAWYTRPIQRGDSKATIKAKCLAASQELGLTWAKCLGVKSLDPDWSGTIYRTKRADPEGIQREILKYSVKGSHLLAYQHPIGPIIRALQCTRLVTSWGNLYGKLRQVDGTKAQPRPCECCGEDSWMPEGAVAHELRTSRPR